MRKPIRHNQNLTSEEWSKHLEDLRALSVLANQATEYVYNKNKTEGKTGVIKPDLIPLEKRGSLAGEGKKSKESPKKSDSPKKLQQDVSKVDNLERITKELTTKTSPEKSKVSKDTDKFIKSEQLSTAAKQTGTGATTTASTSAADNAISSSPKSHQSPSKTRTKPTDIKKPGAVNTGRLKTTTAAAIAEPSELEKLAAVRAAEKSKSPTSKVNDKTETKSTAFKSNEETTTSTSKDIENTSVNLEENKQIISTSTATVLAAATSTTSTNKNTLASAAPAASPSAPSAVKDNAKRPSLKRHKDSLTECKPLNVLVYAETTTAKESAVNTLKEILADNT